MRKVSLVPIVPALVGIVSTVSAQTFEIYLVAPAIVAGPPGTTYSIDVWGQVTGEPWVDGISAIASFGIDIIAESGSSHVQSVSTGHYSGGGIILDNSGLPTGPDLLDVRGGQLANLFGFLNPNIDLRNPIKLFTFEVTLALGYGMLTYMPMNPAAEGGLSFYPVSTEGATIVAPNDPGTTLTFTGATTWVFVPAPGAPALIGVLAALGRKRLR